MAQQASETSNKQANRYFTRIALGSSTRVLGYRT